MPNSAQGTENAIRMTPTKHPFRWWRRVGDLVLYLVLATIIVMPFSWFVAQPFIVSGTSMLPTFKEGEYLVIDKWTYHFAPPQHGDIVIVRYPLDPSIFLIKRVIALPGETVFISGKSVSVGESPYVMHILKEPYIAGSMHNDAAATTTLEKDEYFLLGDNRDVSTDSRTWGPLQSKFIVGRVLARVSPLPKAGIFPGEFVATTSAIHTVQ